MASCRTLFCALHPPWEVASDLWDDFAWLPSEDDRVEPERQHVTLLAIGAWPTYPEETVRRIRNACAALAAPSFRVVFDHLVMADRILLKPSETVPALVRFQRRLASGLADAGLVAPGRYRFSPHLTLSYRTRAREPVFVPPVSWVVRDFVLLESLVGRRTQVERGRWTLEEPVQAI
jgi:2'-5' RNA ligase